MAAILVELSRLRCKNGKEIKSPYRQMKLPNECSVYLCFVEVLVHLFHGLQESAQLQVLCFLSCILHHVLLTKNA